MNNNNNYYCYFKYGTIGFKMNIKTNKLYSD